MKNIYIYPLVIVGGLFLLLGSALGINSLLIPFLKEAFQLTNASSYLILTATFSAFVVFGYPSGLIINRMGYKKGIVLSFVFFTVGSILFIPSGLYANFVLFLLASFILGMGNTLLQAAVNPYITMLGPIESAAKRMCLMTICNRAGWAIAPIFLSLFLDISKVDVQLQDLFIPFYILTGVFIVMGFLIWFIPLPEIKAKGENLNDQSEASQVINKFIENKSSVFQFPHLLLGVFALFFYVGVDTLCLVSIVDFAHSLELPNPEKYTIYPVMGISIGCMLGVILIPKYLSQIVGLKVGVSIAFLVSILIPLVDAHIAIYMIPLITFFTCLTWGAVWPLAISFLGKYTKIGSSLLVSSIVGGALLPLVFGYLRDLSGDIQKAYWLFVPSLLFILFYAFRGYKVGLK